MKSIDTRSLKDRLLRLAPYSMNLGQFGLLLYFISPAVFYIHWLFVLLNLLFTFCLVLSVATLYVQYKRDRFQLLNIIMGQPKERLFDGMIGVAGLVIGFAYSDYAVLFIAALTLFNGLSGFFFPNGIRRR